MCQFVSTVDASPRLPCRSVRVRLTVAIFFLIFFFTCLSIDDNNLPNGRATTITQYVHALYNYSMVNCQFPIHKWSGATVQYRYTVFEPFTTYHFWIEWIVSVWITADGTGTRERYFRLWNEILRRAFWPVSRVNWRSVRLLHWTAGPHPPPFPNDYPPPSGPPVADAPRSSPTLEERDDVKIKPIKLELLEDDRRPRVWGPHLAVFFCIQWRYFRLTSRIQYIYHHNDVKPFEFLK